MAQPLLIVLCGLPGAGKSALARALERRLGALRWDKDALRELLFPAARVVHDRGLNDFCMEILYAALPRALSAAAIVILDGRPFTERAQRERVREAARQAGIAQIFVRCNAPIEVLRERITRGVHPARDRDARLLERLVAQSDPFEGDEIAIDTAARAPAEAAAVCLEVLAARGLIEPPG